MTGCLDGWKNVMMRRTQEPSAAITAPRLLAEERQATLQVMVEEDPHRLRRRMLSLGVPFDDADDAAQSAFLRAWKSVGDVRSGEMGALCSWMDVIARNVAIDVSRRKRRFLTDSAMEDVPDGSDLAQDVMDRQVLAGALEAIGALPDSLREAFLMSVVDERSSVEIAEALGIAPAAARQRIARARKRLETCRESGMSAGA